MASRKTECTELAIAFGLLSLDPAHTLFAAAQRRFRNSLTQAKFTRFQEEYGSNQAYYSVFSTVGADLRRIHGSFRSLEDLEWTGGLQMAATTAVPRDLLAANIPISVKANSDVVSNLSPQNLLRNLPSGQAPASNEANWFLQKAAREFQAYYECVRTHSPSLAALPPLVEDFDSQASRQQRRAVQAEEAGLRAAGQCYQLYVAMCRTVSQLSENEFNSLLSASLGSTMRASVTEHLLRVFLRLDAVGYILCGLDRGTPFAVHVPDITSWKSGFSFSRLQAAADQTSGQGKVRFLSLIHI